MFSRRSSLLDISRSRLTKATRRRKKRARLLEGHPGTFPTRLRIEQLEERNLLSINLSGVPQWIAEGPGPTLDGQVENVPSPSLLGDDPVSGAAHTVLVDPADADTMYVGTTNGGIWKTTDATNAAGPTWLPLTDQFPSLSISTLEFDPTDPTNNTIVAGIGAYSSFTGRPSGPLTGLLRTTDGGDSWQQLGNFTLATPGTPGGLAGISVSGLAARGSSIIVAASNRGTGAGVYLSTDTGQTFSFISGTNGLPNAGEPLDLVADPGNNSRLYVSIGSTAAGGVFRTDNATAATPTWTNATDATLAAALSNNANNFELAVSAAGTNPVYAGVVTNGQLSGIFRSGNQGTSWVAMDIPQVLAGATAIAVGNMTGNGVGPIVVTSVGHGLATRENPQVRITGSTGNTAANGDFFVTLVDPDAGGPLTINDGFSLNGTVGNGNYTGGAVWSEINGIQPRPKPGSQGNTHFSIAADPTNANLVYVGGDRQDFPNNPLGATTSSGNLWRGDASIAPGGPGTIPSPQWTPLTHTGTNNASSPHADSREMRFLPNGDLLEVDDGGIYFRTNPQSNNGDWFSLHGNLQNTEFHSIAYDSNSDVIIGGAQDTGTPQQFSAGSFAWDSVSTADGGDVAVDNIALAGANQSIRYSSTQFFGGARRRTYDAAGNFVGGSDVTLPLTLAGAGTAITQGGAGNMQFVTPIATNNVVGGRLVVGGVANVWESTDFGATVSELFAPGNVSVPVNGNNSGQFGDAIATGGMLGGAANPDVLYVGSGNQVFVRTAAGGTLNPTTPPGAGRIIDVAIDPDDWMTAYAIDTNSVFMTTDAGNQWADITGDLVDAGLRSLAVVASAAVDSVLVGGLLGVSRAISTAAGMWAEFGSNLPNAPVWDLDYDATNDKLIAGTLGRGAWSLSNVTSVVFDKGVLEINGDMDFAGQDDLIELRRDANNPSLLQVLVNGVEQPGSPFQLDTIQQINVNGLGGDDTLIVDTTNGLVSVDMGIRYDGGLGFDRLDVTQDVAINASMRDSETVVIGALPGSGQDLVTTATATQLIEFINIEPVTTNVIAANFDITSAAGIASLLQDDNQITYLAGSLIANSGRVEVDNFEPIEFSNKTNLTIEAGAGDDTVVLDNGLLPTGLETVNVFGDSGNDTIRVDSLPSATATTFVRATLGGNTGDDVIDASNLTANTPLSITGGAGVGADTITGGAGNDAIEGEGGDDIFIDSPGDDIYDGGDGNDTLIFRGTNGADVIDVFQLPNADPILFPYVLTLNTDLNPAPETMEDIIQDNGPTVERVRIEALGGDDIIRVGHADEYNDPTVAVNIPAQTIPFEVLGDSPNASDRLVVPDDGAGDLVIQREGPDDRSGSITVGGNAPIDYSAVEFVNVTPLDPITGGTGDDGNGRLVVFKHDPFESNNTLPNATFLGAGPTINVDPTIDPAGIPFFGVPGDNDFYQFVAQETGTLDVQLYFEPITTLANGRPGLPVDGELFVQVLDSDGITIIPIPTATDLLDPVGNKIGERITVPVVRNNTYYLRVQGEVGDDVTGINVYNFTAITTPAPIPELVDLQADSDSGRNNTDDITKIQNPTFNIILDDDRIDEFMNLDLNPDTVNDNAQTLNDAGGNRIDYGVEVFNNAVSIGFAYYTGVGNTWEFTATVGDLNEGDFNHISAAVWIRDAANPAQIGRHELSQALQITLDTITPPISFGLPNGIDAEDGLVASSDSGVLTDPATFADRVTSDTTPTLWGRAEANTVVMLYHDNDGDGVIDLGLGGDAFLGQTVAVPLDGNQAFPFGYWEITSILDLNEIPGIRDGLRNLLVTAEDVAGNPMPMNLDGDPGFEIAEGVDDLSIFIDTQGPQIYDPPGATEAVHPAGFPEYDLFDPKPSEFGYTPLTRQITINVRDLPLRSNADPNFLYDALQEEIGEILGNYTLVGDHVGQIGIVNAVVTNFAPVNGQQATATINLVFADFLPDDRYTLTISDNLVDPAGNNLDGESNASGPLDDPTFPSGDSIPGGDFVARFTIDSRPEIGSFVAQNIDLDINGNFVWDPANDQIGNDATNVDLTFTLDVANADGSVGLGGYNVHDLAFAGRFVSPNVVNIVLDRRFDQLAAYGFSSELGQRRWLVDTNSDGVITLGGADVLTIQPDIPGFNVAGALPIAGNFDGNAANGDEIGLYFAGQWALDLDRDFVIEPFEVQAQGNLLGHPIVGDFDGNGVDDFGVFNNNVFTFDLSGDFNIDDTIQWGFPGVLDRAVAADFNQDGVDDIGLWVPRNSAQDNRVIAEWYFLISDPNIVSFGTVDAIDHPFEPVPFGRDLYAEFGDELAMPIVGNFDPPVAAQDDVVDPGGQNIDENSDLDADGDVDGADFLAWQRGFGTNSNSNDLDSWQENYGQTAAVEAATAASEPTSAQFASLSTNSLQTELVEAAIAWELLNEPREASLIVVDESSAAEPATTDQVFAADGLVATAVVDADELYEPRGSEGERSETEWLSDELLELVFS